MGLTYLAWNNWFHKQRQVFSNYDLYGFPYTQVKAIPDIEEMEEGVFCGDELWLWLDSWAGRTKKKKIISSILLKSRKRGVTIIYTAQSISQITKRIRDITDFVAYPLLSVDNSFCRVEIFRGPRPIPESRIKPPLYFNCEPVIAIFNTYQEVKAVEDDSAMKEVFKPVWENPAWLRYLHEKGIKSRIEMLKRSREIQKAINPNNIKSEKERIEKKPDFRPIDLKTEKF